MCLAKELGERRIIEIIFRCLDKMPNNPVPLGDDASGVDIGNGKLAVIKTDMLVEKTDVPPQMSLRQAARKAVVMNVSDLAAKGVRPTAVLAAIGAPQDLTKKDIEQIGKGLNDGAQEYGAFVLGGDTNEASELILSCTAFGLCEKDLFIRRSNAKPGDIVATTGPFGKTMSGLKILLENFSAPPEIENELVNSVLIPHARLKEGITLAQTKAITASIDSSDGLAWSLHEISKASEVGFFIDTLPISPEARKFAEIHDIDPIELTLYGGEEYELIVTINPKMWKKVEKTIKLTGTSITKIGRVTEDPGLFLKRGEETVLIEARGWEHFTAKKRLNKS